MGKDQPMIKKILREIFQKREQQQDLIIEEVSPKLAMRSVYLEKKWGGKNKDFYSGGGSHSKKLVGPYVRAIKRFLASQPEQLIVCDFGCGDFNVGKRLVGFSKKYHAFDVVEELIARNREQFKHEKLTFDCLDIVADELPKGDCVLIRQVLQHLSNDHIKKVVPKLQQFKYAIITEHLPKRRFEPNLDKTTGVNIRLSRNSGVVLHEPPFSINARAREELLRISYNKGVVVSTLYTF